MRKNLLIGWLILLSALSLAACGPGAGDQPSDGAQLKIAATTTIVGDVVAQVGGDQINLSVILPIGTDPHSFDPTPQDIAKVADADLVFANGAGLEAFLAPLLESAGAQDRLIAVSDGIEFLNLETEESHTEDDDEHDHGRVDPHTWTDPNNVMVWVQNIAAELSQADPAHAETYAANAAAYTSELEALDAWIRAQIAQIPPENRLLVSDHTLFGYYVDEYGLEQLGALVPGYSTLAEPTAQELAAIERAISDFKVKAVFVGNTVNPALAERVAEDTGTKLVYVYTGSLSDPGGEAETYLAYLRYNTTAFVDALK